MEENTIEKSHKPKTAKELYKEGNAFYNDMQYTKAIQYYHQALSVDPSYVATFIKLGDTYSATNEIEKAIEWYLKTLEMSPDHYKVYIKMGKVMKETNR